MDAPHRSFAPARMDGEPAADLAALPARHPTQFTEKQTVQPVSRQRERGPLRSRAQCRRIQPESAILANPNEYRDSRSTRLACRTLCLSCAGSQALGRRRPGVLPTRHAGPAAQSDPRRPGAAEARNDCPADEQPAAGRCAHPLAGPTARPGHGPWIGRCRDPAALGARPAGIDGRTALGRHRRHALVDLAAHPARRGADDAARVWLLAPLRVRMQAPDVRGRRRDTRGAAARTARTDAGRTRQNGNTT